MSLPDFMYHPDPLRSGSVVPSDAACVCCAQRRGYRYDGPVYAADAPDGALCPWCIADGSAHRRYDATFVDDEALADGVPDAAAREICERTPGYATWQGEDWPACCGDATAFQAPTGIDELRAVDRELEGLLLGYIVHDLAISGGAATRLLASLRRDTGPTAYLFRCRHCARPHFRIDRP